jgi:asparagine synthetase B (glutamine-hydrolysing)
MTFGVWIGSPREPDPDLAEVWRRSIAALAGGSLSMRSDGAAIWLWTGHAGPVPRLAPDGSGRLGDWIGDGLAMSGAGQSDAVPDRSGAGSWAWVAGDGREAQAGRDSLGRTLLLHARVRGGVLIASREAWLLAHPELAREIDEEGLVAWLAQMPPAVGRSLVRGISSLAPGEQGTLTSTGWRGMASVAKLRSPLRITLPDDALAIVQPLVLGAVARAFDGARRPALLLSAGIDSSLVAAAAVACGIRPLAITHGSTAAPGLEERPEAARFARKLGLDVVGFDLDVLAPWRDGVARVRVPDHPWNLVYRELRDGIYAWCQSHGVDRLVDGNFGDELHAQPLDALADDLLGTIRCALSPARALGARRAWRALRRRLSRMRGRPRGLPIGLDWLRQPWRDLLRERFHAEQDALRAFPRPEQAQLLHGYAAELMTARERIFGERFGVDYRPAFHDPALFDAMLRMPSRFSLQGHVDKWLFRSIGAALVEDEVWWRQKVPAPQSVFHASASKLHAELGEERKRSGAWLARYLVDGAPTSPDEALLRDFVEVETIVWARQLGAV